MMDIITNINQLLPFVAMRPEFEVRQRDGFQLIDYDYQLQDTFDIPELMECRGIKFCPQGLILARPFKKFFNYGEKESDLPLHRPHHVTKKMDGSMVHGILLERRMFLHSRGGHTDVAKKAELFLMNSPQFRYENFIRFHVGKGWTPIFEYTAPHNRIVLRYEEEALTLIGCRHMISGQMMSYGGLKMSADTYNVPVVESIGQVKPGQASAFVAHTRALKGEEGYVIHFDDGYLVKIKADEYVCFHRSLDKLNTKRKAVELCAQGFEDDVLPILHKADVEELTAFNDKVQLEITRYSGAAQQLAQRVIRGDMERKDFFAVMARENVPQWLTGIAFGIMDGKDPRKMITNAVVKNPSLILAKWRGE